MTCLTGFAVYWVSDHAFNQSHQNWVDMFTENIRQDMVKGNHSEVFRKCKKFANEADGVVHLVIKDSFGKDVCNEGLLSTSPHLIKKIYFDSNEAELVGEVEVLLEQKSRNKIVMITLGLLLFGFSLLTVLLLKVGRSIQNSIIEPFVTIHHALRTPTPEGLSSINLNGKLSEIIEIESSLKFYGDEIGRLRNLEMKSESLRVLSEVASQVAHDIRSPLSALNMVSSELGEVPEEKRLLIRNSIQRINDIANDLLAKGKLNAEKIKTSSDTS
jgi:signal transduction histidine kinase